MPILHVQLTSERTAPDGTTVQVAPAEALVERGPRVQVVVAVATPIAEQLLQQGTPLPPPVSGLALIDTGASSTCVDETAAQALRLPVVDVVRVASASHAATSHNVYPIQVEIVGAPISIDAPRAIGAPLAAQGLLALIGRDVLQHCALFYNGPAGQLTLTL